MEETKSSKYLSEVIDYEKDIEPYKLIMIYSGVGSGKNYWVQTLAEQGKSVLFITSRKITAEVQAKNIDEIKLDLEKWHRNTVNGKPVGGNQYLISRTNAWVNHFARNIYDPEDTTTHIWKYFDFIFLDEAHSVVTDATFADSSFQVWRFMSWILTRKDSKNKVILMSGTPQPLKELIPEKTRKEEWYRYHEYFDQCNHVDPKNVIIRQEDKTWQAAKVMKEYYDKGKRIIYFTSSIGNIIQLIEDLSKQGITEADIGVSFTNEEKKDQFTPAMLDKKKQIEESLKTAELLPDDVKIFLTTTKNKEGINIQNDDVKIMFAESSQRAELIQMAGRVRNGLDELNVMYNLSRSYGDVINKWRRYFGEESIGHITDVFNEFVEKNEQPSRKQIIADIENSFPYVRYDFFRHKFLFFEGKELGEDLAVKDRNDIEEWIDHWDEKKTVEDVFEGTFTTITLQPGKKEFQKWFPFSTVPFHNLSGSRTIRF